MTDHQPESASAVRPYPGASASQWLEGARPHTWANAFAPVLAGTAAAQLDSGASFLRALLAAIVALALIIGAVSYTHLTLPTILLV